MAVTPLDLSHLKVYPLAERQSLTRADEIVVEPDSPAKPCSEQIAMRVRDCAQSIRRARERNASIMLIYGAHLLRNGAAKILERMMDQ